MNGDKIKTQSRQKTGNAGARTAKKWNKDGFTMQGVIYSIIDIFVEDYGISKADAWDLLIECLMQEIVGADGGNLSYIADKVVGIRKG
jgi:hypothetical protein